MLRTSTQLPPRPSDQTLQLSHRLPHRTGDPTGGLASGEQGSDQGAHGCTGHGRSSRRGGMIVELSIRVGHHIGS